MCFIMLIFFLNFEWQIAIDDKTKESCWFWCFYRHTLLNFEKLIMNSSKSWNEKKNLFQNIVINTIRRVYFKSLFWHFFTQWFFIYRLSTCFNRIEWNFMHTIWCSSSNEKTQLSTQERATIATSFVWIFWKYAFLSLFDYHCRHNRFDSCSINKSKKAKKIETFLFFLQAY